MALARDLMRGGGFYHTQLKYGSILTYTMAQMSLDSPTVPTRGLRPLPTVNYLDFADASILPAAMEELSPVDKDRVMAYAKNRCFGIALVAAPTDTGETSAACLFILFACYCKWGGKVFGSAPTDAAVSKFACRLQTLAVVITERCNLAKHEGQPRQRRLFVLRGHHHLRELDAFMNILRDGVASNAAHASSRPGDISRWELPLTPANWLLAVFGSVALEQTEVSGAVKGLHLDDAEFLHDMRARIEDVARSVGPLQRLVQLARGEMTWDEYLTGDLVSRGQLIELMSELVNGADVVLTTPACALWKLYQDAWANADAIAIDEADRMHVADFASIWGNTLRPLSLFGGDVNQFRPCIMELSTKFGDNFLNPLALTGRISALCHFQGNGLPVLRLSQ